uniref:Uncharacterized protein n=1 Tax=Panagrellus redivivus TaxID=6233 RepID=A0A7E4VXX1_PANRE
MIPHGTPPSVLKSSRFTTSLSLARSKGFNLSRVNPPPDSPLTSSSEDDTSSRPLGSLESARLQKDLTELQASQVEGMSTVRFVFDEPQHEKPKQSVPISCRFASPPSKPFQRSRAYVPLNSSFTASLKHSMAHALARPSGGFATSRCRPISEGETGESQTAHRDFYKSKPDDCPLRPTDPRYYCSQFTTFMEQEGFTLPSRFKMSSLKPKNQPNLRDPTFKSSRFVSMVGAKPKFVSSNSSNEDTEEGLDFDCDDFGYFLEKKRRDNKKIIHVNNIIRTALFQFFKEN